jgi:aldehyde:ferredoxin oxidoreductase
VCLIYSVNQYFGLERLAELYSAATGIETDAYEIKKASERGWNIFKALNVREGLSRKDDKYPRKWMEPLKFKGGEIRMKDIYGIKEITEDDLEKALDDYYDEREWDVKTGKPNREILEELGLRDIADDLSQRGLIPPRRPKGWHRGHWGPGVK